MFQTTEPSLESRPAAAGRTDGAGRLIVALDVPTVVQAREIVAELDGLVSFFKVGLHLQWDDGVTKFIDELVAANKRVFVDYKYNDIGATMKAGIAGAARHHVDFMTIQGSGATDADDLAAALAGRGGAAVPRLLLVTVLTSLDQGDLETAGIAMSVERFALARAVMARNAGMDGVIASAREARAIREATGENFLIVTPGIRPVGAPRNDQKRAAPPAEAVGNGADYLVVGRPVVASPSPATAAKAVIEEMQGAFDLR